MTIHIYENAEQIGKAAAAILSAQVLQKPDCVLGLATGSSVLTTYSELIAANKAGLTDFSRVTTFNLDEYCGLPSTHEQSYKHFMRENLFNHINIDESNIFVPNGTAKDIAHECGRYEFSINNAGGIDLQLLGLGNNGHIAFNEPADAFRNTTHCVQLSESTIAANSRFFASEAEVPRAALTMGIGTIMRARKIVMVVYGAGKREAVAAMVRGAVTPKCPASVLQLHSNVVILADKSAVDN
ncbi:MAG: glucosamine-6-phosphate deaminase [Oscillospiraceae bacterium]|nr:glucosamine-6-phosphate deaminase [Oscillospiraceae bacterium]